MTNKLLSVVKGQIPIVGFVNESQLYVTGETDERIALLRSWLDAGAELGNHTYSHIGFRDASLAQYQDDFVRGDTVINRLLREKGKKARYFRHPFLQMGTTPELEKSFRSFMAERGYQAAPITIDSLDWMISSVYRKVRNRGDLETARRVSDEYLKFVDRRFAHAEETATELFGRNIDHILLLHANELTADNLDNLVKVIERRGYKLVTLEQALSDPVYQFPERYIPTSNWLRHWSFSKQKKYSPPMPAEFITKIYDEGQN